jgi:riboflavin synthase
MRADGRFGGHFVQGHVDGTATLRSTREDGDSHRLAVTVPAGAASYLVEKGSVALDGVSLTVAALRDGEFEVMIVPFTWAHTSLSSLAVGDRVNLEYDLIGKYVVRALELATVRPK